MATTAKKAILQALIEGVITELMVKTNSEQVYLDDTTTLSAKLAEIIASLNAKATSAALASGLSGKANTDHAHEQSNVTGLVSALSARPTTDAMNTAISNAITELINGAPGTYDTLKEIADYIADHEDVVTTLNTAIGNKLDKSTFETLKATVDALGTLSKLDTVSEANLDSTLKTKIGNAHTHSNKALLDTYTQTNANLTDAVSKKHSHSNLAILNSITSDTVSDWDSKGHIYYAATEPSGLAEGDLWVQLVD